MALADRYREPRASAKHTIETLRVRRRVLARGQRLDVRAALGPETGLSGRIQTRQYRMLSVILFFCL